MSRFPIHPASNPVSRFGWLRESVRATGEHSSHDGGTSERRTARKGRAAPAAAAMPPPGLTMALVPVLAGAGVVDRFGCRTMRIFQQPLRATSGGR